jgi:transcriptional regulator with XRE-family HTH domain
MARKNSFGARLLEARRAAGLSQQALADQLGIGQARVAEWEAGKKEPRLASLEKLLRILPSLVVFA